jgi:hypothetical protein
MNPSKSKSLAFGVLAAFFTLTFAAGCGNKKSEKKDATETQKPKMDTGEVRPIVPPNKAETPPTP